MPVNRMGVDSKMKEQRRAIVNVLISISCILAMLAMVVVLPGPAETAASPDYPTSFTLPLQLPELQITDNGDGTSGLLMEGYPSAREIGLPALPSRVLAVALPPGTEAAGAVVVESNWYEVPGTYNVEWGQQPIPSDPLPGAELPQPTKADSSVYDSDSVFPEQPVSLQGNGRMRKYSIADIRVTPVRYSPASGRIEACKSMIIRVDTSPGQELSMEELAESGWEEDVKDIVDNFDQAQPWYEQAADTASGMLESQGTGDACDYMIITTEKLAAAVEPLKVYKESLGLSVQVQTMEWIEANCTGVDGAEKVRNYLKDNYSIMGIDYVLIAGAHYYEVPMRQGYVYVPGFPGSGYIYTDYYYCDLSGDWDLNDDGKYGEMGVDDLTGGVDFYPEVYVGRIPINNPAEVQAICEKIVAYSCDSGAWKRKALLLGATTNFFLESPWLLPWYGSTLMEKLKQDILAPQGFTCTTMYEKEGLAIDPVPCDIPLTQENVVAEWSQGYGIVNVVAHGSCIAAVRKVWSWDDGDNIPEANEIDWRYLIDCMDAYSLDDTRPSIFFSCACYNGDTNAGWTMTNNLIRSGACAVVASTSVSYGTPVWQGGFIGGNEALSYYFWKYLLVDGQRAGKALRMADVWQHRYYDWWGQMTRANLFDFNLFGDPSMKLDAEGAPVVSSVAPDRFTDIFPATFTITGSNFLDGATVRLAMEGQGDIEAAEVIVDSSTSIRCTFDVANAEEGDWDVVVRNPDGQEALLEDAVFVRSLCGNGSGLALLMLGVTLGLLSLAGSGGLMVRRRKKRN